MLCAFGVGSGSLGLRKAFRADGFEVLLRTRVLQKLRAFFSGLRTGYCRVYIGLSDSNKGLGANWT